MLTLPLAVAADGTLHTYPVDSVDEVAASVALLLDTRPGERRCVPAYGLPDPVFQIAGVREQQIRDAVEEWEPRADLTDVDELVDGWEQSVTVWTQWQDDEEDL